MWIGCRNGHLSVCKWLFEVGAAADITKASIGGFTPMYATCQEGHLSVCKWLFEVGAAADIREAANNGRTPMRCACDGGYIVLCQWLVRVGALNQANDDDEVHEDYFGDGHVDQAIVAHDVRDNRPALLEWALDAIAINHQYRDTVLRGSIVHINTHQQASPANRCRLPILPSGVLERVGRFVGVVMGRQLRNVREFAEALATLPDEEESDIEDDDDDDVFEDENAFFDDDPSMSGPTDAELEVMMEIEGGA
jgi:hypothetical protein